MTPLRVTVNGKVHDIDVDPEMPLLWVLRDELGMLGTKFGCGEGQCGACTVHVDGVSVRSCVTPIGSLSGGRVTTIEGIAAAGLHAVQQAWLDERVPQCGYCQAGQIMAAVAFLADHPQPSEADISEAMSGILCRCGTYPRIRKAILRVAGLGGS